MKKFEDWEIAKKSLDLGIYFDNTYLRRWRNIKKNMVFKHVLKEAIDKIEFKKNLQGKIYITRHDKDNQIYRYTWQEFLNLKNAKEEVLFSLIEKFIHKIYHHIYNKNISLEKEVRQLFSLDKKPFDLEIKFNDYDGIIDFPISEKDSEIIKFDIAEIESLNSEKLDRITSYLLRK